MRAKALRYNGGFKLVIDVPNPEPVPDGFRFVEWSFFSVEVSDEPETRIGPDELTRAFRAMLHAIDENGPKPSMIATDDAGNWLANSFNLQLGEWAGWMWSPPRPFDLDRD